MGKNVLQKLWNTAKNWLVYEPPQKPSRFVLEESNEANEGFAAGPKPSLLASARELEELLLYSRRLADTMESLKAQLRSGLDTEELTKVKQQMQNLQRQQAEVEPILLSYSNSESEIGRRAVSASLDENEQILRRAYHLPLNKDLVIRSFKLPAQPKVRAFVAFTDGLSDKAILNRFVLQPLMENARTLPPKAEEYATYVMENYILSNQASTTRDYAVIREALNAGDTVVFLEGCDEAVVAETKGWEHRPVDRPQIERTVRGSQEAFGEILRINTALIRKTLKSSDLVTEMFTIGVRSKLQFAIMYLKSVANPSLVQEVKRRLQSIEVDYLGDSGVLEQMIEDHPNLPFPQTVSTERPDRVGVHLSEGRIAILANGNPFVLIVPVGFFSFFHTAEDFNMKPAIADLMRILRYFGAAISLLLPSVYLSITLYHQEALPTEMALAIAGARERVPFPGFVEILLMEFSFELIREAGLRIPGALGSTIGIVGAIILGQAAVTAHIVSPIMVVIIAVTGLASYTIPEFRMAAAVRLIRFYYLLLASMLGLVGVASGLVVMAAVLASMKSFGMPYLVPLAPKTDPNADVILRGPAYHQEKRPDALNTQDEQRQASVSRGWIKEDPREEDGS